MEKYVFADGLVLPYIASRQNARVTEASKLADKKYRERSGMFLCEGVKLTLEAALYGRLCAVYLRESDAEKHRECVDDAQTAGGEVFVLSDAAFDKITTEKAPQGIICLCEIEKRACEVPESGNILFLDELRDPGNLGTVLRSACAFGDFTVVLHSCADLYSPKTVRAAMGALFKLKVLTVNDGAEFVENCRSRGRRVLGAALVENSLKLGSFEAKDDDVVVIGNEGHGISKEILELCDSFVMIPMNENTESLNASVAASVILWEYAKVVK